MFLTIGLIALLAAISPGPDFAIVAKNALTHHRRQAILTSIGIGLGLLVHTFYCVVGLALIITQSTWLFNLIRYLGAAYLFYLGIKSLFSHLSTPALHTHQTNTPAPSTWKALREGVLTNVLNPKCTLFMLSIFTIIIRPDTPIWIQVSYGIEIAVITAGWFVFLSYALTHPRLTQRIQLAQPMLMKVVGILLIGLAISIFFEPQKNQPPTQGFSSSRLGNCFLV